MISKNDDISHLLELVQELDFAAFVPESFQAYLPLIEEGLACFVDKLPPERRWQIIADQAQLPETSTIEQRMVRWMRACPTLHKLGQLLARDRRLPIELRAELQELESLQSQMSVDQLRPAIESQLGSLASRRISLAGAPLAEASVAIVVPFDSPQGSGILKVLKPGIKQRLEEDLEAWDALAEFLDMHRVRLELDHIDYRDTMQRVRELLCSEVNLTIEQEHLAEAATLYGGHRNIAIPKLLPHCSPQITAMEFLDGDHVTSAAAVKDSGRLARTIAEALVVVPIFNTAPSVLFHGDPHAGNLLVTGKGRLGLIDWGLAGHLSKVDREQVIQVLVGCLTLDPRRICGALDALAVRVKDARKLRDRVEGTLVKISRQPVGGIQCMMDLLDSIVIGGDVVFAENMLLFRKLVHIAEGVIADLDPACSLDRVLLGAGFRQFWIDGLVRPLAAPCSRAFGMHLSNMDLAELMCIGPLVAMRRWQLLTRRGHD
jgi:ubiquinone biosynthesis protein